MEELETDVALKRLNQMSDYEFAEFFTGLLDWIHEDPLENFVKHKYFMDFNPTPAQTVALKCTFGQPLDEITPHHVWMETADTEGIFALEKVLMTEVELFRFMTDQEYMPELQTKRNRINLIVGRRGGKCQVYGTTVLLADGSTPKIEDLIGKAFEVWAYDEATGKRVKAQASCSDNGVKEAYRIKTRTGFVLERTFNHKIMTEEGWIESEALKLGHQIQIPRENAVFGKEKILADEDLITLGYLIGDGSLSSGNFGYSQIPGECQEEFCKIIEEFYGGHLRTSQKEGSKCKTYHPSQVPTLRSKLKDFGLWGKTSKDKFVPEMVFTAPKEDIALFLNRLFSTDGSLYEKSAGRVVFEYSTVSEVLAHQIKHLLSRFGIVTFLREKWVKYKGGRNRAFILTVGEYAQVEQLIQEIGIKGKDFKFKKKEQKTTTNHPLNLMPKKFWDTVDEKQNKLGFTNTETLRGKGVKATRKDAYRLRKQYGPNREKLLKIYKNLGIEGKDKEIAENYWFDEIVEIEYLGERKTAGLTVEKYHTYINDVVEHNTTLASMLALFCAIKTNWKPYLKKTPSATIAILSHSREFSDEVLDIIRLFVEESPVLSRLMDMSKKTTQSTFNMKVPFLVPAKSTKTGKKIQYSRVTIKVGAASKKTIRGKAICALLCDEIAYWNLEENSAEQDEAILRAARPALLQFQDQGLLIKLSSPGIKQGLLYNEYIRRHELPESYLTLKAPSWVWNTILLEKEFREEYILDPTGFDAEFRANFVDAISNFIMPEYVDLCTIKGQSWVPPEGGTDIVYCAALDAAFKGDRFAFTLLGWDGTKVKQYVMKTWKGSRLKPVKAKEVAKYIRSICKEFGISRVHADQYSFQPLREIFEQYGVTLIENPFTNTFKKQIYFNLRKLIHNQGIDLLDHEIMSSEIKQLQVEQTTTGTIRIGHPPGGTDDCMPGDTLIKTEFGYRPIKEIVVGDKVYTHKGRLREVQKTFKKQYTKTSLYSVKPHCQLPFKLTANHPILVNSPFYGTNKKGPYTKFGWKLPCELKKSYKFLGLRRFELNNTEKSIELEGPNLKCKKVEMNSKFSMLLGCFLGDGWAIRREKSVGNAKYLCTIAFNAETDRHTLAYFRKYLKAIRVASHVKMYNKCAVLRFHSKILWNIFVDCYDASRNKVLPKIAFTHNLNIKKLIMGWLLADGNKVKKHVKTNGYTCLPGRAGATTSKALALDLKDLAWREGIEVTIGVCARHRYGKPTKDLYTLAFRNKKADGFMKPSGELYIASRGKWKESQYTGLLYNLHVREDESYVANGVIVHNCSDSTAIAAFLLAENLNAMGIAQGQIAGEHDYVIRVDSTGRAFDAPSGPMLGQFYGYEITDNTNEYVKDEDGKWKHVTEIEDEDFDGGNEDGSDFLF